MKEYKVVNLNKAIHMSRDKDLAQMEESCSRSFRPTVWAA